MVIGCDFGLRRSGIVLMDEDFGIKSQSLIQVQSRGAQRLIDIEQGFQALIKPFNEEKLEVFVEGYAYGAKYQRESLAELGGVMRRFFCLNGIDYWVIPPTKLKSFVTGSGRATKNYMKKCTKEKWNLSFKSDDVCDAHGLARLGVEVLYATRDQLDPTEREIVEEILINPDKYRNSNTAQKVKNDRSKTSSKTKS